MKANLRELTDALDAGGGTVRFFLLYGPDESGAAAHARRLERAMGPDAERIDLEPGTLKSDPARLSDEAAALSLFGDRRWVRITGANDDITDAVAAMLDHDAVENPVLAMAGALKPSSALLKLALAHPKALVLQCYVPESGAAAEIATALAREAGLRIDRDVARAIAAAAANDRAIMAREIEKLALYCDAAPEHPAEADMAAFDAVTANADEGQVNRLVHAIMGGRPHGVAAELAKLEQGSDAIRNLRAVQRHIVLLAGLRAEVDAGSNPAAVVEARGKAIFWRDREMVTRQVGAWSAAKLATAAERLLATERSLMAASSAGEILADAEMIAISRVAQRAR